MDDRSMLAFTGVYNTSRMEARNGSLVYSSLERNEIRLLRILPNTLEDLHTEICCDMVTVLLNTGRHVVETDALRTPHIYTALSYTWGSPPADCHVRINGHQFDLRKNLWRFLYHARKRRTNLSKWFWIDAICIEQSNITERTSQIKLMSHVFRLAESVLIWLGPSYNDSDTAMSEFRRTVKHLGTERKRHSIWAKPSGSAIRALCARPYWSRLWGTFLRLSFKILANDLATSFQELVLARHAYLMCGESLTPWRAFEDLMFGVHGLVAASGSRIDKMIEYHTVRTSPAMTMVKYTSQRPGTNLGDPTLWNLIFALRDLGCTELHDKVFALLAVAAPTDTPIEPNYAMPMPTLLNLVLRHQHEFQPPNHLEEVGQQCKKLEDLFG